MSRTFTRKVPAVFLVAAVVAGLLLQAAARATIYEVGPSKQYATIGAVPWNTLQPGDTVKIYWLPTGDHAYHEKLMITQTGTVSAHLTIEGVPGPNGELPILDGQNATTSPQFAVTYTPVQDVGVVYIWKRPDQPWAYKPAYIDITNLEIRNASVPYTYTDFSGATRSYVVDSCGFWAEGVEHLTVTGCIFDWNGNGFFVKSGGDEPTTTRNIVLQGCYLHDNGAVGEFREHNIYTEACGVTFQYNWIAPLRAGALGNALKDRSAGTIVRYNWIQGGAHLLDLVEPEDGWPQITVDPNFHQTFVYGNVFVNGPGDGIYTIHYGGDNGDPTIYRKGWLYFYDNTWVSQRDQSEQWKVCLFDLSTNDESADVRNNVVLFKSATPGAARPVWCLGTEFGTHQFGVNWLSAGWQPVFFTGSGGVANGTANLISNAQNDPGFANLAGQDFHLTPTSQAVGAAGALAAAALPANAVVEQYVAQTGFADRPNMQDLGAFAASAGNPSSFTISGTVTANGTGLGGVTVSAGTAHATTASDGTYTVTGLAAGSYTVAASLAGYSFSPTQQAVTVGPSATSVNFSATASTYTVSGSVTVNGAGLSGVTVSTGGTSSTTASDGTYTLSGLAAGSYTVTATLAGYSFTPAQQLVAVGPNKTGVSFQANALTYTVSGTVTANGSGLAGVVVSGGSTSATTAANGSYTLSGLAAGTYTVTPSLSGHSFTPASQSVTVGPSQTGVNFAAVSAALTNNAGFVSQSVPSAMTAGQTYQVSVTMTNTGTSTWTGSAHYALGSQNPRDNLTWGLGRVPIPGSIAPGQQATFTFNVVAPSTPGTYNFQWEMVQDGVEWFGATTPNVPVQVSAGGGAGRNDAQYISQSVPSAMTPGQTYQVSVTMTNTGTSTWTGSAHYALGSQNPRDNLTWGLGRVPVPGSIAPGQQATYTFNVVAPSTPGTYNFQWRMVQDGVEWFGAATPNVPVRVGTTTGGGKNDAQFVSQNVPATVGADQKATVSVTMKNTGTTVWPAGSAYRLGSQSPQDNLNWGIGRVALDHDVNPGDTVTFTFTVTAPSRLAATPFQWRMVQDGVEWFGDNTPLVQVRVWNY